MGLTDGRIKNGPTFRVKIVNLKKFCSLDSMGVGKTRDRGWGRRRGRLFFKESVLGLGLELILTLTLTLNNPNLTLTLTLKQHSLKKDRPQPRVLLTPRFDIFEETAKLTYDRLCF